MPGAFFSVRRESNAGAVPSAQSSVRRRAAEIDPKRTFELLQSGRSMARDHRSGNVKENVEPVPTVLLTEIFPPWSSINFREMARPRPVPSTFL